MKLKLYFLMVTLCMAFTSFSQTLDQSNTTATALVQSLYGGGTQNLSQSFTVGNTGQLSRISVNVDNVTNGPTLYVNCDLIIYNGEGFGGTVLGTYGFAVPDYFSGEFAINFAPIAVTSNQIITFKIVANTTSLGRVSLLTTNDTYSGGVFYNNASQAVPNRDLWFKTFVTLPAPATHLNFDGVNDYVQVSSGINLANSSFTVEFMAKRTATNVNNYVLKQGNQVNNNLLHIGFRDNNNFTFAFWYNDINIPVSNYVADTNWHHWSCVYNNVNGTRQVYQDGVLVASDSGVSPYTGSGAIQIGSFNGSTYFYNGGIDDVRIWNVARTAEQISGSRNCELQGSETGLVAYYNFNQGIDAADNTGITSLIDATANANNGTLVNFTKTGAVSNFLAGSPVTTGSIVPSVATVTTPVTYNQGATATALTATVGANGTSLVWYTTATGGTGTTTAPTPSTANAGTTSYWVSSANANGCESARRQIVVNVIAQATHLNFDGVNDYVTAGNILPSSYTKEAMIFLTASSSSSNIISGSNSAGQHAFWVPNRKLSAGHNNTWGAVQDAADLALNTWYHVAVSYDSATQTLRLYKNGVLISTAINIPAPINGNQVLIGSYDNGNLFNGNIDEVRIWNKVLTATDIMNHMNCELQSAETGLVAYYKFNQGFNSADNTSITTIADASGNANNGTLTNFARTGSTSNFLSGSPITTGNTCTTLTLSTSNFEITNNIKMYPNPTNNFVTVEVNNLTNAKLQVLDITGKILINQALNANSNNVDVQHLPSGMYLFKVSSNEGISTGKIIKN